VNNNRRKFLKIALIGSASFMAGKILGPALSKFLDGLSEKKDPIAYKVAEDKKSLYVYDDSGEEVLQIDKSE
jgi:hypothetical protein